MKCWAKNKHKERTVKKIVALIALAACLVLTGTPSHAAVTWKMAHYVPVDSMIDDIAKKIAEDIEKNSKGEIAISLFPAGQLGDWMEMSEQIMRGGIQIGIMPVSAAYNRAMQIRVLPYCVMNWAEARKAFISDNPFLFNIMAAEMEKMGLKALAVVAEGFGGLGFSRVPDFDVCDPDSDKQGYKIRVPGGNRGMESLAQQFGFIPASVPWGEIYIALQTGLVDCQLGAQPYNTYSSFLDITKMWAQLNTHFQQSFVYMNRKTWESLSPELRKVVLEAAKKHADTSFERAEKEDRDYMKKMEEHGVKIVIPTEEQYKKLAAKVRENTWPLMVKDIGQETLDKVLNELASQ